MFYAEQATRGPRICGVCKVFIKWASLIEINWIKIGLIK